LRLVPWLPSRSLPEELLFSPIDSDCSIPLLYLLVLVLRDWFVSVFSFAFSRWYCACAWLEEALHGLASGDGELAAMEVLIDLGRPGGHAWSVVPCPSTAVAVRAWGSKLRRVRSWLSGWRRAASTCRDRIRWGVRRGTEERWSRADSAWWGLDILVSVSLSPWIRCMCCAPWELCYALWFCASREKAGWWLWFVMWLIYVFLISYLLLGVSI